MMQRVPILMYHQVDELTRPDEPMRGLVVSPRRFASQMKMLKRLGYVGLSMAELAEYWLRGKTPPKRVVGITFDDGYENNLTHAMPVLKSYGFSATCYVVTGLIGQTNAWDSPDGVPSKRLLTLEQLQRWQAAGQHIGSHTHTHANLQKLSTEAIDHEMRTSQQYLLNHLGAESAKHFCYPYGAYDHRAVDIARDLGFATATTTVRARATLTDPPLEIPRVLVSRTTTAWMLAAKLLTHYEDRRDIRASLH